MTIYDTIEKLLGNAVAQYAKNKHTGGHNGNKGTRYEDFFLVFKAAEAIAGYINHPSNTDEVFIQPQTQAIVDDLCVSSATRTEYYQCKNVASIGWKSDTHPLVEDFEYQFCLSTSLCDVSPTTHLVLSCPVLATKRQTDIPPSIRNHTQVAYFPWHARSNVLVQECKKLQMHLSRISLVQTPTLDVLSDIFAFLLAACMKSPDKVSVQDLWDSAHHLCPSRIQRPCHLPSLKASIRGEFEIILDKIPELKYDFRYGVFSCSAFGIDFTFPGDVSSQAFQTLQNTVISVQPRTYDEFEVLLP